MQAATAFLSAPCFAEKGVPMSSTSSSQISSRIDRQALIAQMAPHQAARPRQALWQLESTWTAYVAVVAAMYSSLSVSVWLTLALAIPAAGLTVRIFIIQHDCGHGAFFRCRLSNEIVGSVCGIVTMTPYGMWRRQHSNHHGVWNNLDRRSSGTDIYSTCLTLEEYLVLSDCASSGHFSGTTAAVRVPAAVSHSVRCTTHLEAGEDECALDERWATCLGWWTDAVAECGTSFAGAAADHGVGLDRWRMAVFSAAPVRGSRVGAAGPVEPGSSSVAWQYLSEATSGASVVFG
jgi:hypothetical protein